MHVKYRRKILTAAWMLLLVACAAQPVQPVLYPNERLKTVGEAASGKDIQACMALARESGIKENKDGQVAEKAAKGAVVGAVASGAWGLVMGDAGQRAAAGAAAGAASGAVVGAMDASELDPVFKRFVEKCLRDKGYEVIGWQ